MADEGSGLLLNEVTLVTLTELAESSGLTTVEIRELVELGAFEPRTEGAEWLFTARSIELARAAHRLRAAFDLSAPGIALVLAYVERIRELEQRLRELECQLPR